MKNKKIISVIFCALLFSLVVSGCQSKPSEGFNSNREITVVARDAASGTRGAFHEIMEVIKKQGDVVTDNLAVGALEFDGTDKVITAVEGDKYGIGYISIGSVSNRTKTIAVDSIEPSVENVKSGAYAVQRPFLLITKGEENNLVKDFLNFAESVQGQDIITNLKFIGVVEEPKEYTPSGLKGTIKIAGSTSVTPVVEKLQEAYINLNPNIKFEMQSNGSSQGIKAAMDGSYDIGMSSRELKEDEAKELNRHVLAIDGIAIIINNINPTVNLSREDITKIYTGEITRWDEIK